MFSSMVGVLKEELLRRTTFWLKLKGRSLFNGTIRHRCNARI